MVSAISPSSPSAPFGSGPSAAGLQAQLDRYQKQLSDCVNCDTANTQEGKRNIQELSGRISEIKERIQETTLARADRQPSISGPGNAEANPKTAAHGTAFGFALTGLGTRLDVFA